MRVNGITIRNAAAYEYSVEVPPLEVCTEVATLYFAYIHDPTHHLFHKPSFLEGIAAGHTPLPILLGVIALAARFGLRDVMGDVPSQLTFVQILFQ